MRRSVDLWVSLSSHLQCCVWTFVCDQGTYSSGYNRYRISLNHIYTRYLFDCHVSVSSTGWRDRCRHSAVGYEETSRGGPRTSARRRVRPDPKRLGWARQRSCRRRREKRRCVGVRTRSLVLIKAPSSGCLRSLPSVVERRERIPNRTHLLRVDRRHQPCRLLADARHGGPPRIVDGRPTTECRLGIRERS